MRRNLISQSSFQKRAQPPLRPKRASKRKKASFNLGPTARSAATAHDGTDCLPTDSYLFERLQTTKEAEDHLELLLPYSPCPQENDEVFRLLRETAELLPKQLPPALPFLTRGSGAPRKLRVETIMREWLLISNHPPREGDLREFLLAYQDTAPLSQEEIEALPLGLRLAVADKCRLLPSPEAAAHIELLPSLLQRLATTCRFIYSTNWRKLRQDLHLSAPSAKTDKKRSS